MAVEKYTMGTEYLANEITLQRGTPADITGVGVYHNINPNTKPAIGDFTMVDLIDSGPLQEGTKTDVLSRIGPKVGADLDLAAPGDYQRWVLIQTADEDIVRKVDVVTIK